MQNWNLKKNILNVFKIKGRYRSIKGGDIYIKIYRRPESATVRPSHITNQLSASTELPTVQQRRKAKQRESSLVIFAPQIKAVKERE